MKKNLLIFVTLLLLFPTKTFAKEVEVSTKKGLFVRKEATTNSSKIGGIVYKSKVNVYENTYNGNGCSNGWYMISEGKYSGYYICSNYLKDINNSNYEEDFASEIFNEKVVSVKTNLNLRKEPSSKSEKLTVLSKGKNYVATERIIAPDSGCKNNTWYKIQVNESSGYVCSAYVRNGATSDKYVESCSDKISEEAAQKLNVSPNETFVEVNLTTQKLTLYQDGVCVLKASTVTGKEDLSKEAIDTAEGNFTIIEKTRNKYFTSSDVYSNYWMRFYLGMGLHDADNWRNKYGYRASHGCVNLPLSATKTIYDTVSLGTKVIVHK